MQDHERGLHDSITEKRKNVFEQVCKFSKHLTRLLGNKSADGANNLELWNLWELDVIKWAAVAQAV
jgi:hypothetical protein